MQNRTLRTLGVRLGEARERKGLSQVEAAEALDTTQMTISRWERDAQDPNTGTLLALAKLYKVSVDWLLTEREDIIHHGQRGQEQSMEVGMSQPSVELRIVEGALSQWAIDKICTHIEFACWQVGRRRRRRPTTEVRRSRRSDPSI